MTEHQIDFPCNECELPAARFVGRCLVIKTRHHGQKHTTIITFAELREWIRVIEEQDKAA